jgi:glycosyltransferase involved in cell wall biosynthesis
MRILKIVQSYFPFQDRGGPVFKVRAIATGLAQRGHQVTVLTADLGLADRGPATLKIERCPWGWRSEHDGIEIIYLPSLARYRAITINPRVIGFCRASLNRFDVAHFYGLYDLLGPAVSYFCRRRRIPYVIEPMGMHRPMDRGFRLKRLWCRSLGRAYWRGAARIVATSELESQELLEDGVPSEKMILRYNGVDARSYADLPPHGAFRAQWAISQDEPLILFLSRLIPRKGADILIEAFAEACPESGRLVIVGPEGEAGYRAFLERRAIECRVAPRVLFTGPLYDEKKIAALADADIFALPSRYENFANVAAEAMACGVPVIITRSCGISSLVEGQAGLVIPREKNALVEALRKLIDDKTLHARLAEGCRRVVARLDWSLLCHQMEDCYGQMLAERNAAR